MYCLRPGSNVKLHVPNLMLMSKFYCSTSFALDSAHVKFDVWPEPYSSLLYFALTCFTLSYPPQSTSPVILDFTSRSPHLTSLQLSSAYLNLFYPNHTVTRELSFSLSFGFCKGSKVPWNLTQTSRFLRVFYNIKYCNCQRLNSCAFFLHKSVECWKSKENKGNGARDCNKECSVERGTVSINVPAYLISRRVTNMCRDWISGRCSVNAILSTERMEWSIISV